MPSNECGEPAESDSSPDSDSPSCSPQSISNGEDGGPNSTADAALGQNSGGMFVRNLAANLSSQLLVGLLGIVAIPLLVSQLGSEGYGLVAFFLTLQALFVLLDLGLSQALLRQTARVREGVVDIYEYQAFYRTVKVLFGAIAALVCLVFLFAADWISGSWLTANSVPSEDVKLSVQLMGLAAALRWLTGLYRGVAAGFEEFVWIGGITAVIGILRYLGAVPVLWLLQPQRGIVVFMVYQLAIGIVEVTVFYLKGQRLVHRQAGSLVSSGGFKPSSIFAELRFSIYITIGSVTWLFTAQTDRIVLSYTLPLSDYGIYSLAVTLSAAVILVGQPLLNVINPRLTRFAARGLDGPLQWEYVELTSLVAWIAAPVALTVALAPLGVVSILN